LHGYGDHDLWPGAVWQWCSSLTLAGAIDIARIVFRQAEYRLFDDQMVAFAQLVARVTPAGSLVLHAAIQNDPVALAGRRSLMGYPGHVWTHGIDPGPREQDLRRIYSGEDSAQALIQQYGVDYLVVSPLERMVMPVNEKFFQRFPVIGRAGEYTLYRAAGVCADQPSATLRK
jgi:hypothetical protein